MTRDELERILKAVAQNDYYDESDSYEGYEGERVISVRDLRVILEREAAP